MGDRGPTDNLEAQREEQRRDVRRLSIMVITAIGLVPKIEVFDRHELAMEETLRFGIGNILRTERTRELLAKFGADISAVPSPDELDRLRHLVTLSVWADLSANDGDIDPRIASQWEPPPEEPVYPDDETD